MANRIKIQMASQPGMFSSLTINIFCADPVWSSNIYKVFVPSGGNSYSVVVGSDVADTLQNLYNNLVLYNTDNRKTFSLESGIIYINFSETDEITANFIAEFPGFTGTIETFELPVIEPLVPIDINLLSIEVIDTYDNSRVLIDELTEASSPTLSYEGGDDIFEPFMASSLTFNIADLTATDAKFFHLMTGDEKRYLVKLSNIDSEENLQLVWQGFLLPDQYKEPWKNGVVFVDFTASDMIASLKGKYLDPWFYYQKFTNPEFFSMVLKMTGLRQEIQVKPSIINADPFVQWKDIIVNLEPYVNDGKYEDVYKVLQDVLSSQCLQLCSFRGQWLIEGFTRKGELSGSGFIFDADGSYQGEAESGKPASALLHSGGAPHLTAVTPFGSVDVNFAFDQSKNLYPDDVTSRIAFFTGYTTDHYDETTPVNTYFKQWLQIGASWLALMEPLRKFAFTFALPRPSNIYLITEAQALSNYFECPVKPFASQRCYYEIDLEFSVNFYWGGAGITRSNFEEKLQDGDFDQLVVFQLLLNNEEFRSNRPSSETLSFNKFDSREIVSVQPNPDNFLGTISFLVTFKLKREFQVGVDGYLTFRILSPITAGPMSDLGLRNLEFDFPKFKINVVDGEQDENVRAVRDINFTQKKSFDLPITCSVNATIANSFSIGKRVGLKELTIPVSSQSASVAYQTFPPLNVIPVTTRKFSITDEIWSRIFVDGKTKSVFIEKASGKKIHFFSLYTKDAIVSGVITHFLHYLYDYIGRPFKPKDYTRNLPVNSGDTLKMLLSDFTSEDFTKREYWHVYGFPDWKNTYVKTVANAIHAVRKEPSFNLETNVLKLVFPKELIAFKYDGVDRIFIPTRLTLDLFAGQTRVNAKESTLNQITDITYE